MIASLTSFIPHLARHRVMVVGDVILDEYIIGNAERLSREAPIPVLEFRERRFIPGGAANPAANIVSLGSDALQVGIVGQDQSADHLRQALQARGIQTEYLIACEDRPTTLKTRIMAHMGLRFPQQVARVDTLSRQSITPETETALLARAETALIACDALLFSDYHGGLLVPSLIQHLLHVAQARAILTAADAQGQLEKYRGLDVVKCNADDARAYLERDLRHDDDFAQAAKHLQAQLALRGAMVITRGADGATVAETDGTVTHCPAPRISDVYDTVGAGDTMIAVLTLARLAGASYPQAVMLANYASGIVVRHVGNYTPAPHELLEALTRS